MSIPDITHLQFLIMGILMENERAGQAVRDELAKHGVRQTGPGFYQMMARLEDAGFVKGRYEQKVVGGQVIKERRYKLSQQGLRVWKRTCEFYNSVAKIAKVGGLARV